jgi:hypothetical protein
MCLVRIADILVVWPFAYSAHGLAFLRTLSSSMSPIKEEKAPVNCLQFLNPLLCVCYLLAVLDPMTSRFSEGAEGFWPLPGLPFGFA